MRLSVLSAALLLAAGPAFAQEMIENGEFTAWHKFKKGTSITTKITSSADGMTFEKVITMTLVDVGPDKLVLDSSAVTKAMGMEIKEPAVKRDVPKTVALPKGAPKPPPIGTKPEGTYEEGTETLKVGPTEVKAKWYKVKTDAGGVKTDGKVWMSEDVPGMVVKMAATTTGTPPGEKKTVTSETKLEVVEFKKP